MRALQRPVHKPSKVNTACSSAPLYLSAFACRFFAESGEREAGFSREGLLRRPLELQDMSRPCKHTHTQAHRLIAATWDRQELLHLDRRVSTPSGVVSQADISGVM